MRAFVRNSLCAALLVAATQTHAAQSRQPAPHPAMWKLESETATIYFLGSIHLLPRGAEWRTDTIQDAIDSSDIFYFEMPLSDGEFRDAAAKSTQLLYLPKGQTLSGMLSPAGKKKLAAMVRQHGFDMKAFDRLRPWAASELLAAEPGGPSFIPGVDKQIGSETLLARKTRRYFESGPEQAEMSARMGDADGAKGFEAALAHEAQSLKDFNRLYTAWLTGDTAALDALIRTETKDVPNGKKIMFDDRNAAWAKQIPDLLREHRTFLITVGAGHLVGKGSVIDLLCSQGLEIERIETKTGDAKPACPDRPHVVAAKEPVAVKGQAIAAKKPVTAAKGQVVAAKDPVAAAKGQVVAAKDSAKGPVVASKEPAAAAKGQIVATKEQVVATKEPAKP